MAQKPVDPDRTSSMISLRVVDDVYDSMGELARQRGTTKSKLMREALAEYLERQGVAASA